MFHSIALVNPPAWAGIQTLVLNEPNNYLVNDSLPTPTFPTAKWAKRISIESYADKVPAKYPDAAAAGIAMGQDIYFLRYTGRGINEYTAIPAIIPAKVIVDELWARQGAAGDLRADIVAWAGAWLSHPSILPVMQDQWACFVQHVENAPNPGYEAQKVSVALAYIFLGGGYAVFEMYARRSGYCGNNDDTWLKNYYGYAPNGGTNVYGFLWAWNSWPAYQAKMQVVFGVIDAFVCPASGACDNPNGPIHFMDRMFYVWKAYLPQAAIGLDRGGPGSWSWGPDVTYNNRSNAWATIWTNYIKNGLPGPNYAVTCP